MPEYWIGAAVGSLIFAYLWTRLWLWLTKRLAPGRRRILIAYGLAYVTAIVLGAIGFADGGPLNWGRAFMSYTPSFALWLIVDLLASHGRRNWPGVGVSN